MKILHLCQYGSVHLPRMRMPHACTAGFHRVFLDAQQLPNAKLKAVVPC